MTGTLPHYKPGQFFNYLNKEGAKQVAEFADENLVCFEFQDRRILIQIRSFYNPCYVYKVCDYLKIPCPEEFKIVADQIREASERLRKGRSN